MTESKPHSYVVANTSIRVIKERDQWRITDMMRMAEHTVKALPEDLQNKVGLLMLVDPHTMVEDVGYRYDNNIFYVGMTATYLGH